MKKFILLLVCLSFYVTSLAQLYVNHDGETTVKKLFATSIYTDIGDTTTHTGTKTVITGAFSGSRYTNAVGVFGSTSAAINNSVTRNVIGVKGQATKASGMNFGVYGVVPPSGSGYLNYGAGIYGTTKNSLKVLSNRYAGYFDGDVGISGNMNITGTINGVVISRSASNDDSKSMNIYDESSLKVLGSVSGLRISSFYYDQPIERRMTFEPCEDTNEEKDLSALSEDNYGDVRTQLLYKKHYSLSSNDLEEVFPDLVYDNEDGTKSINYVEMVPILVQAIKELSAKVEALEDNKEVKKNKKNTSVNTAESVQVLSLGQNKPNPFSSTTDIEVSIPETVQTVFLYVYDLQGKKVQQVDITARGKQTVNVNAAELAEGMYLYSLIADGKVVETRRMIVEK